MAKKSKSDGSAKDATLAIRIRPKLKYGLELLARKQHRSASAAVETMLVRALEEHFRSEATDDAGEPVRSAIDILWDVSEGRRLLRLALYAPELMSFDDEERWRVIRNNSYICEPKIMFPTEKLGSNKPFNNIWFESTNYELDSPFNPDSFILDDFSPLDPTHDQYDPGRMTVHIINLTLLDRVWPDVVRRASDEISQDDFGGIVYNAYEELTQVAEQHQNHAG